jgi:hypothetical protein
MDSFFLVDGNSVEDAATQRENNSRQAEDNANDGQRALPGR